MAKGKHPPAPGAVRKDKVIHPCSRKAAKLSTQEHRRSKLSSQMKTGSIRMQQLADKLLWFRDNIEAVSDDTCENISKEDFLQLIEGYLNRFSEELEQIGIKSSIGGNKNRRLQHASRKDSISLTMKTETEEFEGCGLELPDLMDKETFDYFRGWNGELRFIQNIKLQRFKRSDFSNCKTALNMDTDS